MIKLKSLDKINLNQKSLNSKIIKNKIKTNQKMLVSNKIWDLLKKNLH